jgi:hypothetical protein
VPDFQILVDDVKWLPVQTVCARGKDTSIQLKMQFNAIIRNCIKMEISIIYLKIYQHQLRFNGH